MHSGCLWRAQDVGHELDTDLLAIDGLFGDERTEDLGSGGRVKVNDPGGVRDGLDERGGWRLFRVRAVRAVGCGVGGGGGGVGVGVTVVTIVELEEKHDLLVAGKVGDVVQEESGAAGPIRTDAAVGLVNLYDGGAGVQQGRDATLVGDADAHHFREGEDDVQRDPEVVVHLVLEVVILVQVGAAHVPLDLLHNGVVGRGGRAVGAHGRRAGRGGDGRGNVRVVEVRHFARRWGRRGRGGSVGRSQPRRAVS